MTEEQVLSVKELAPRDSEIESLIGVEHFTNLEKLYCYGNKLTALDVHANTKLKVLQCDWNQITEIDLNSNAQLKLFSASGNRLTGIDVSKNTELESLDVINNPVMSLDLTQNAKLKFLYASSNEGITELDLSGNPALEELYISKDSIDRIDVRNNPALRVLSCENNCLTELDLSHNPALTDLNCNNNELTKLDVTKNPNLTSLGCAYNRLTEIDVSRNPELNYLYILSNELESLDVSKNTKLQYLYLNYNRVAKLNVDCNPGIEYIGCCYNRLAYLNLEALSDLDTKSDWTSFTPQYLMDVKGTVQNGVYSFDLKTIIPAKYLSRVIPNDTYSFDPETGVATFPSKETYFEYRYDTGKGDLYVCVFLNYEDDPIPFEGTVEWNRADVQFKGTTAYVIANGSAQTPRFTVRYKDGTVIGPENYEAEYLQNTKAGTGYLLLTFQNAYKGTTCAAFKIYLPATTETTVENVKDGVRIAWKPVDGAAGYVIYRRAWSSTTDGWTTFERWNNTTGLSWTDTKVYAGTRYQYGVKAYFARRFDPIADTMIGGNVGDNFNLGEVGPLKTTVRITTRTLSGVTAGRKQMTVKWGASSVFTGYQIKYATDRNFTKNVKVVKITNPKTAQTVIKSLKSGATYYVTVRSYHVFNGMTYFGQWSNTLSCRVK